MNKARNLVTKLTLAVVALALVLGLTVTTLQQAAAASAAPIQQTSTVSALVAANSGVNAKQAVAKKGKKGKGHQEAKVVGKAAFEAAAKALGLTSDELKAQLKAGKSIADVATDKKVDLKTVKDAMTAAVKTTLDAQVKDGKLTQAQADKISAAFAKKLDKLVNHKHQPKQPKK